MKIRYLFSGPGGDIPLGTGDLARPFRMTPSEDHPFLTLGDYFRAIEMFILAEEGIPLLTLLRKRLNRAVTRGAIREIRIRSEKHGALYHLAGVELLIPGEPVKFSVATAVTELGKTWLSREYEVLRFLEDHLSFSYLPEAYFRREVMAGSTPHKVSLLMFMARWLEDYHEWHLSVDKEGNVPGIRIWDMDNGHRFASEEESAEIFRQAARILTRYYDSRTFRQIHPWHHAAGDFVVKTATAPVDVKLSTARGYEPLMLYPLGEEVKPTAAALYFFLNLALRMRLDKLDGVGEVMWADAASVPAVLLGFFEALNSTEAETGCAFGRVKDLLDLLKTFSEEELQALHHPLLDLYRREDPEDFRMIRTQFKPHVRTLHRAIRDFHL